jgi:hypothetical protein
MQQSPISGRTSRNFAAMVAILGSGTSFLMPSLRDGAKSRLPGESQPNSWNLSTGPSPPKYFVVAEDAVDHPDSEALSAG